MAQPQQQQPPYPMPQRPFSPPQPVNSPSTQNQQFAFPPHKRQRTSPNPPPSQPGSPYVTSPYAMSPGASGPASASPSPHFSTVQLPQTAYTTPYSNGLNAQPSPSLNLPQTPGALPPHAQPSPLSFPGQIQQHHQGNLQAAHFNNFNLQMPQQHHPGGIMGPPSRPVDKNKLDGLDPMDVLGGTGVDLAEEEQYTFQQYSSSFNAQVSRSHPGNVSAGHSFTQFPPGHERSFYGSGPANQLGEVPNTKSQEDFEKKAADKAWHDAARDLAVSRQRELNNPFLIVSTVHRRMEKIAHDNGLGLNTDFNQKMGTMKLPEHFPEPNVKVQTAVGPEGAITATTGTFIPADSLLVDQLALMSISTKYRLRGLVEDAIKLSIGRQTGSHAQIRDEWADVAVESRKVSTIVNEGGPRIGWESAVSPLTNSQKRPHSAAGRLPTPVSESAKTPTKSFANEVAVALRKAAGKEQEAEEARIRKRKARESGDGSRAGSINPGTPGSIAPDILDKPPTKKEMKRKAEAKTSEAASHAAANVTTTQFLGGRNVFGKKKQYSWMTSAGGSGSGTSTPGRIMPQGLGASSGSPIANPGPEKFTTDGVRRLGTWREDGGKGRHIQLRDWIMVLEDDGREKKALQKAYALVDGMDPK
ncbi:hypothetical protein SBOR_0157 [Sclerotinia borealis F-4128]|uniref:Transcription initiation factor TFIID subunit 4 n=1 Tax=Sclerotinia borealis (strain F-4128) TaxID=1432307 RepID=W9CXQ1_SCLBF|nr:hypothetical protein SBOR_0157 [Sclerotinia borealis F-4128]